MKAQKRHWEGLFEAVLHKGHVSSEDRLPFVKNFGQVLMKP